MVIPKKKKKEKLRENGKVRQVFMYSCRKSVDNDNSYLVINDLNHHKLYFYFPSFDHLVCWLNDEPENFAIY